MRQQLPLNALRGFEASARHLSFTKAAEELHVTQGAVSRHVKQLEDQIQRKLFHRLHRQLVLTDEGRMLLPILTEAFDLMEGALARLNNEPRDIKLKVHPTFAIRFLIPRLYRFQRLHPDIQVRLTTSSINVDFNRENFDVGIIYMIEPVKNEAKLRMIFMKIAKERLTPVCSPFLLENMNPIETIEDLRLFRLLHSNPEQREWRTWAKHVGIKDLPFDQGQTFEMDDAALQAAASGLGIALGDISLIREDLESGRLTQPFEGNPQFVVEMGAYYLALPHGDRLPLETSAFKNWLLDELHFPPE